MICFCGENETNELKVEADVAADPIWCNKCSCNLELEDIPISNELKKELMDWVLKYGEWIDWDNDEQLVPNGIKLEEKHNEQGAKLTEKVKYELEPKYKIKFSPSTYGISMNED